MLVYLVLHSLAGCSKTVTNSADVAALNTSVRHNSWRGTKYYRFTGQEWYHAYGRFRCGHELSTAPSGPPKLDGAGLMYFNAQG